MALHMVAHDSHALISVHDSAVLVHCQQSVRIPVECQTYMSLFVYYSGLKLLHMGRAAVGIDIGAVRIVVDGHNACPQLLQRLH